MLNPIGKLVTLLCVAATPALHCQEAGQPAPTTLVVTYRCNPEKRADLRNFMRQDGLQRLEGYRRNAVLAGYRVLLSRYADTNNWDMMVLLSFADYSALDKWKRVEHQAPAGLPPTVLAMATSLSTYPLDLIRQNAAQDKPAQPVYLVVPFTNSGTAPAYRQYVDEYETPRLDGGIGNGVLANYEIYTQRYAAARPWDALFLLKYKDEESLGKREEAMAKIRQQLQGNAKWQAIDGTKQSIRVEKEAVIADELTVP